MSDRYPRSRAIRGLLRRVRAGEISRFPGRGIVDGYYWGPGGTKGTCRWCGYPCEGNRFWHSECGKAYRIALGHTTHAGTQEAVIPAGPCEECGIGQIGVCAYCSEPCRSNERACRIGKGCLEGKDGRYLQHNQPVPSYRLEIDHRLAVSIAWEWRALGRRGWWKAWHISNLRWLCRTCHRKKTAADRWALANLRNRQIELLALP